MILGKFAHRDNKFDWTGSSTKLGVSFALKKAAEVVASWWLALFVHRPAQNKQLEAVLSNKQPSHLQQLGIPNDQSCDENDGHDDHDGEDCDTDPVVE